MTRPKNITDEEWKIRMRKRYLAYKPSADVKLNIRNSKIRYKKSEAGKLSRKEADKKYRDKFTDEEWRSFIGKKNKKYIESLHDGYVADLLASDTDKMLKPKDIPKELIEAKKVHLKTLRLLKNLK